MLCFNKVSITVYYKDTIDGKLTFQEVLYMKNISSCWMTQWKLSTNIKASYFLRVEFFQSSFLILLPQCVFSIMILRNASRILPKSLVLIVNWCITDFRSKVDCPLRPLQIMPSGSFWTMRREEAPCATFRTEN